MNQFLKRGLLSAVLLIVPLFCHTEIAAADQLTTQEVSLLDKHFSPSSAAKVKIGTKLQEALQGASLTPSTMNAAVFKEATGTLSQANLTTMYTTPVVLVAAPGAGKITIIDEIEFFHDYATAAYTGGGDVTIEYATSGLDLWVFDVALVTANADDNWILKSGNVAPFTSSASTGSHSSLTTSINKAVQITNATAVFGAGNASNVIKYRVRYHTVTVQT